MVHVLATDKSSCDSWGSLCYAAAWCTGTGFQWRRGRKWSYWWLCYWMRWNRKVLQNLTLFLCSLPWVSVIHARTGILQKVAWPPGLSSAGCLAGEESVLSRHWLWIWSRYESAVHILANTGWRSAMLLAGSIACWTDYSNLAVLKWELWPVRHRVY